ISVVACLVAFWSIAAEFGWLQPLEEDDVDAPEPAPPAAPSPPPIDREVPRAPAREVPAAAAPPAAAREVPPAPAAAVPPTPAPAGPVAGGGAPAEPPLCREEEVDRATAIVADPETEVTVPASGRPRFELVAAGRT